MQFISKKWTTSNKSAQKKLPDLILRKEFMEKQGGKIWVESEIGKGSEFIFTIPQAGNYIFTTPQAGNYIFSLFSNYKSVIISDNPYLSAFLSQNTG